MAARGFVADAVTVDRDPRGALLLWKPSHLLMFVPRRPRDMIIQPPLMTAAEPNVNGAPTLGSASPTPT